MIMGIPVSSKPTLMIQSQQTEEVHPDTSIIKREEERTQSERDQGTRDSNQAVLERDLLKAELVQTRKLQETTATRDQLKSELEQVEKPQQAAAAQDRLKSELDEMQRLQQETEKSRERKVKKPSEPLMLRLRLESKMAVTRHPKRLVTLTWIEWLRNERISGDVYPSGTHAVLERSEIESNQAPGIGSGITWPNTHFKWWLSG